VDHGRKHQRICLFGHDFSQRHRLLDRLLGGTAQDFPEIGNKDSREQAMRNKPKRYWSAVFYQATVLMRERRQLNGETAFWLARDIVDKNLGSAPVPTVEALPLYPTWSAGNDLVLAP
jgi:hypothetical protein